MGISGLDEYEAWLDTLDAKFRIVNGGIRSDFDVPFSISLLDCNDVDGIVKCATKLRTVFLSNSSHLPVEYLLKRFIRLAIDANRLPIPKAEILSRLPKEWDFSNWI